MWFFRLDRDLIILTSTNLIIYIIRENNENVELYVENKDELQNVGGVYKGRIKRLAPAMNAVFVDIGNDREAFLHVKDINNYKLNQPILVQVKRGQIGNKGAKLTEKIAIPGKYLVLTPTVKTVNISSKYTDENQKAVLKDRVKDILSEYNPENYGYIIRTLTCEASDEDIIEDFLNLKSIWENILKRFDKVKAPSQLFLEDYKLYTILKDYAGKFNNIITDDIKLYKILRKYTKNFFGNIDIKIKLFKENNKSLYEYYEIPKTIHKILNPYVWLKSGGYLVIEETEALVSIDVNSGSSCKSKNLEETAFATNVESCKEIAKHLRLRDLGGIIIIDFIDMNEDSKKEELINILKQETFFDKKPIKIRGFTSLGLLELTRKKIDESNIKKLSQFCYICNGKGYTKSINLVLFDIEKKIQCIKPFAKLQIKINPLLEKGLKLILKNLDISKNVKIIKDERLSVDKYIIERKA